MTIPRQTLPQAVLLAISDKSSTLARSAGYLAGLPIGGWGETDQARRRTQDDLPLRSQRDYCLADWIEALYDTSGARYVARSSAERLARARELASIST